MKSKFVRMHRKAAFEMSVATIVTIVLSVTLLVLGVVFVKSIFTSAKSVVDLTDEQLRDEVNKLFSEEHALVIYPGTKYIEIKQDSVEAIGFGIKNLQQGAAGENTFSYQVSASDVENCGISEETAESWIVVGKAEDDIGIPIGGYVARKIRFQIPLGSPLCIARFKIEVETDGSIYGSDFFDVKINAK